jgi:hypothetical protein
VIGDDDMHRGVFLFAFHQILTGQLSWIWDGLMMKNIDGTKNAKPTAQRPAIEKQQNQNFN